MGRFERPWRAASRRNWAILIACVAFLLIAMWFTVGERAIPGVVVLTAPAPPTATTVVAVPAAAMNATQIDPGADTAGRVEVCGVGWVKPTAEGGADPAFLARLPAIDAAGRRLMASLASRGDEFERAAALWLQMLDPSLGATSIQEQPSGCEGEACAFGEQARTVSAAFRDQLAQMATTTRDPRVYALAFRSCGLSEAGSCALLNARRWAQLDADNGEPWLFLLEEATRHKDRERADEALFHIGAAARVDDRYFAIPGAVARRAGNSDIDLLAAHVLAIHALGGMAARSMPLLTVLRACRGPALADANRRQRCDAVASALAERGDNLLMASVGADIGRQLGWSEARVDTVAALYDAAFQSLRIRMPDPLQWSCGRATSMLDRLARQAVVGEAQFARQWIEASGSTVERYTARETERRRRSAGERARAASASAASSAGEAAVSAASTPYSATPPPAR